MGKDKLTIVTDNPENCYYPGQDITGRLLVEVDNNIKVKEIRINCIGTGYCRWTEGSGEDATTYSASEYYCKLSQVVLSKEQTQQDSVVLSKGEQYTYPFSFTLPVSIPASFESRGAYVRYVVNATIDRPWAFDKHVTHVVNVISVLDLNTIRDIDLLAPGEVCDEKTICCLCCASGPISAVIRTERRGYVPGDTVVFSAEITNMSRRRVKNTECRLLMIVTLISGNNVHQNVNVLATVPGNGPIEPGHSDVIRNQRMQIPPVAPSYLTGCNLIDIRYFAAVLVVPAGPAILLQVKSEIVVGSIPLATIASQYGITVPSAPSLTAATRAPAGLYNDATFANMPHASFAESTFGRADFGVKHKTEEQDEAVAGFVPRYTYYKWNQQDPESLFTVNK